jgi:TonB family protein
MNYPTIEKDSGIKGNVIVRFAITENGGVDFCKILIKSPKEFNDEVLRIMKLMSKWKPGKMNGKFVPVYFTLSFQFEIEDSKPNNQTSVINSVAQANKQEKNRLTGYIVITIVTVISVIILKLIIYFLKINKN